MGVPAWAADLKSPIYILFLLEKQAILPLVTGFKAKLNTKSVQEWFIDLETPDESKRLKMNIRSDAGVRAGKKLAGLGKLGKFTALKLQYNGIS